MEIKRHHLPGLALSHNSKGTAADLTIRDELLRTTGRIHQQFEALAAVWATDIVGYLHNTAE